jgi:hypothetical protein
MMALLLLLFVPPVYSATSPEILRYEVTWNGNKAGHGDVTTTRDADRVNVTVQAVSDGALKAVLEIWSRVQASFGAKTFKPHQYTFRLRSNLLRSEVVDLNFDHDSGLVAVNKFKGDEHESHQEKFESTVDPITAAFLLRTQKDFQKPRFVDVYDGKARARLFVSAGASEPVTVRGGAFQSIRLDLKLVKLTGDKENLGAATIWISNDNHRVPILLTSSHVVGTVRFELVNIER